MKKLLTLAFVAAAFSLSAQNNQPVVGQTSEAELSAQEGATTDVPSNILLNYTDVIVYGEQLVVNRKGDHVKAGELRVLDLQGKLVFKAEITAEELISVQLNNFATGVHLVVVESADVQYVERVFLK
jgi:hypothetical protein